MKITRTHLTASLAFIGYVASIPLANWLIGNVGTQYAPDGPHVIPVGFGLEAPSGVLAIGLALVCRDRVQSAWGQWPSLAAIAIGAVLSFFVASPALAVASAVAFTLGELADFGVYTPLRERHLYTAVLASGAVGAVVDSVVFLTIAFGSTDYWLGNTVGKVWMSVIALPFIWVARRLAR